MGQWSAQWVIASYVKIYQSYFHDVSKNPIKILILSHIHFWVMLPPPLLHRNLSLCVFRNANQHIFPSKMALYLSCSKDIFCSWEDKSCLPCPFRKKCKIIILITLRRQGILWSYWKRKRHWFYVDILSKIWKY